MCVESVALSECVGRAEGVLMTVFAVRDCDLGLSGPHRQLRKAGEPPGLRAIKAKISWAVRIFPPYVLWPFTTQNFSLDQHPLCHRNKALRLLNFQARASHPGEKL